MPFALPDLGEEEKQQVLETLDSGWLTTGPKTKRLEEEFAGYLGVPHALAVNSGTAGLHLALEACGIGPGQEVITSPYTFTATAEVVRYLGAETVFVDIDPVTFNLNPDLLEAAVSGRTRAILPVHFGGQACDMDPIMEIARRHDLKVVEDAAHALPASYRGRMIGHIGDATVFSFYVTKSLATGEGGMIATASAALAERIKIMRLHGIDRDVWDRYNSEKPQWFYQVVAPGFKYNLSDLAAAVGIAQLKKVERFQKRRQEIAERYSKAFASLPLRVPRLSSPADRHAWHLYVIQLDLEKISLTRDEFVARMTRKGIGTSVHFIPLHIQPYWRERYGHAPEDFPVALNCYRRAVSLPIYSKMSNEDVQRVIEAVVQILTG